MDKGESVNAGIEDKEKIPVSRIIVVDDNYADNLAGIFEGDAQKTERPQVDKAVDLESALAIIDSIEDPRGVGVMTDLFFPEKKGLPDQTEGLKVIQEMLIHFGIVEDMAVEMIAKYKAFVAKYGGYDQVVAKEVQDSNENINEEIYTVFGMSSGQPEDPKLKGFFAKNIYAAGNIKGVWSDTIERIADSRKEEKSKISEEEIQNGNIVKAPGGGLIITQKGFEEYNGKGWLSEEYATHYPIVMTAEF